MTDTGVGSRGVVMKSWFLSPTGIISEQWVSPQLSPCGVAAARLHHSLASSLFLPFPSLPPILISRALLIKPPAR